MSGSYAVPSAAWWKSRLSREDGYLQQQQWMGRRKEVSGRGRLGRGAVDKCVAIIINIQITRDEAACQGKSQESLSRIGPLRGSCLSPGLPLPPPLIAQRSASNSRTSWGNPTRRRRRLSAFPTARSRSPGPKPKSRRQALAKHTVSHIRSRIVKKPLPEKVRKNTPASGRWQAEAWPTIAGKRVAVVG